MTWNWEQADWPNFSFDPVLLAPLEATFLKQGGISEGAMRHLVPSTKTLTTGEILTSEAMTTSEIEGELLDRESVRSSILNQLGVPLQAKRIGLRERGIAELSTNLLETWHEPLDHETLFRWHEMVVRGRSDLEAVGTYRIHAEPMQVVSGRVGRQAVHFEAPPSERVLAEMDRFIDWFNRRESGGGLARSGTSHLYFESIHPFEDGNGRVGRAVAEKALAQELEHPSLIMLSTEIASRRTEYYDQLEQASKSNTITAWLLWFADVVLAAQLRTQEWIDFLIAKAFLLSQLSGRINARQEKALLRMTREGPSGFVGGLSAGNYQTITGASPATAGRDLADLVELGALRRTGEGRGTRYWLKHDRSKGRAGLPT